MNLNEMISECLILEDKKVEYLNEYSKKYNGLSIDDIIDKLNGNDEYRNISTRCVSLRDNIANILNSSKLYLSGKTDEVGFLVDIAVVKKDNTYALFVYDSIEEIEEGKMYIEISYKDLRDYLINNKEIKRVIFNKDSVNALFGKSNFIRGNMYGLLIKNKLELEY